MDVIFKILGYVTATVLGLLLACLVMAVPSLLAGLALWLFWNYFAAAFVTMGIASSAPFLDCWATAFLVGVFVRSINLHKEMDKQAKKEKEE